MTTMTKAYLTGDQRRNKRGEEYWTDFTFDQSPQGAPFFTTKRQAEIYCQFLSNPGTKIISPDRTQHIYCKDFKVEEITPGKFVTFCMVPWEPRA